ncbi:MAG: flagellar export chaperone FliS [Rhodopirellula sp.]|nr:flagellar export chaperone FliS [Rhodopirellula sp.]
MSFSAQDNYLTTEVLTATPQRLQLLLVEAAIRCCGQARRHWADEQSLEASESLIHAQNIVTEMLTSLNHQGDETAKKLASVYLFVFRALTEANLEHDEDQLNSAIRVLETERETWQQVCRKFGSSEASQSAGHVSLSNIAASPAAPLVSFPEIADATYGGFSVEA